MSKLLEPLVDVERLVSHFQPIISIKGKRCVAAQALTKIKKSADVGMESPKHLFGRANRERLSLELDRICRRKALEGFLKLNTTDEELLLFLKFEGSVVDQGALGSGVLVKAVEELGLIPGRIVIEINNSHVTNLELLKAFVDRHRSHGFLIAIADLDQGSPNLNRLALLEPDIIKLGRAMVEGIEADFVRNEILKSMIVLAHRVGALVMVDGLETEPELCIAMELGADLLSGYYFSKPLEPESWNIHSFQKPINSCAQINRGCFVTKAQKLSEHAIKQSDTMKKIATQLSHSSPDNFKYILSAQPKQNDGVECFYILDRFGWQFTDTVVYDTVTRRSRSYLFKPAPRGTDHSSKDYYSGVVDVPRAHYVTDPYISMATGKLCQTLSAIVKDRNGVEYVLCMDVDHEN